MAILLLTSAAPAAAQSLSSGAIQVTVTDAAGTPLRQARLTAGATGAAERVLTESASGVYRLQLLPPGTYTVLVEQLGFRPVRLVDVPVRPGRSTDLRVALEPASPPVDSVDVRRSTAEGPVSAAEWVEAIDLRRLPFPDRTVEELGRTSSAFGPGLAALGLPERYAQVALDGVRLPTLEHPALPAIDVADAATLPLLGLTAAALVTTPVDVEWSGTAAGLLSAFGAAGSPNVALDGFAAYSAGGPDGAGDASTSLLQGGARVTAPLGEGDAGVAVAIEGRAGDFGIARATPAAAYDPVAAAADSIGIGLGAAARGTAVPSGRVAGLARLDWRLTAGHDLSFRFGGATLPETVGDAGQQAGPFALASVEGTDLHVGGTLASRIGDMATNELRVGVARAERTYGAFELVGAAVDAPGTPPLPEDAIPAVGLTVASTGLALVGPRPDLPAELEHTTLDVRDAVVFALGSHRLKAGVAAEIDGWDVARTGSNLPALLFADSTRVANRIGARRDIGEGTGTGTGSIDSRRLGFFLQDTWSSGEGLELLIGVRVDLDELTGERPLLDDEFLRLTGIDNSVLPDRAVTIGPRGSLAWRLGERWSFLAAGGAWAGRYDGALAAEAVLDDGGRTIARYLGPLTPQLAPENGDDVVTARSLTLLDPDYRPPRSAGGEAMVAGALGPVELRVKAVYRKTVDLPRRHDLNLLETPAAVDQHGRIIFGDFVKQGPLLMAEPGSSRRFPEYDQVWAIASDGTSTYTGATIGAGIMRGALALDAEYTYSRTEDDLAGFAQVRAPVALAPLADIARGDELARSDLDIPHRAAVTARIAVPLGGLEGMLSGVYRFRSGRPFTPGFRVGVDPNADGVGGDAAFVDRGVPGVDALVGENDCLRDAAGGFAERNACRADDVHALDLRVSIGGDVGGARVEAFADALGIAGTDTGIIDDALYLIDPDAPIGGTEDDRVLPLIANPGFGTLLAEYSAERRFRLGLSIAY